MNVLTFASRKGGSGKSTLAAHLATHIHKSTRRCLLIDADPQGSLSYWHGLRGTGEPPIRVATRGVGSLLAAAKEADVDWVLIDTPPTMSGIVEEAIKAATLVVIPARASVFDLNAVTETVASARRLRRPYAVVINGAPAQREGVQSPLVLRARETLAHAGVPVWGGQITHRGDYVSSLSEGEGVREYDADSLAASEIGRLWTAIEKSVKAIHGHGAATGAMHRRAA